MRVTAPPEIDTSQRIFTDGFGARFLAFDTDSSDPVEILRLDQALVSEPDFVSTVGTRVARLSSGRHALFAPIRRIERPSSGELFLISARVAGWRLAEVLDVAERERLSLDISAVLALLRQLIPAVALFARHQREFAIGTIAPERLILTPQGRLLISEYVLGEALGKLSLTRDQLWRVYRVPAPEPSGASRDVHRVDVLGIGIIALSLLLGRRLRDDEFPGPIGKLLADARESSGRNERPLSQGLSTWLGRALQLDPATALTTSQELQVAFEELLATEREYLTTTALLETFVERFASIAGPPHELHVRAAAPQVAPPVVQPAPVRPAPVVEAPVAPPRVTTGARTGSSQGSEAGIGTIDPRARCCARRTCRRRACSTRVARLADESVGFMRPADSPRGWRDRVAVEARIRRPGPRGRASGPVAANRRSRRAR